MTIEQLAQQDFERAIGRAFWRNILSLLTGQENKLLPFDEIRQRLKIRGQHFTGLKQVAIENIVGSMGRYRDFDRAFLPLQTRTRERWVSINKAHYGQVNLPPVELFKIGELYFVKDGNHRVSVAYQRGQVFIDAFVTEIDIPFELTPDMDVDEVLIRQEQAEFHLETRLKELRPQSDVAPTLPGGCTVLLEHIAVHRWYLGNERQTEVSYPEAVESWYENVYLPVCEVIRKEKLLKNFPDHSEADLYLWIMKYHGYLRQLQELSDLQEAQTPIADQAGPAQGIKAQAAEKLKLDYPLPFARGLVNLLERTHILEELVLRQQRAAFMSQTQLHVICPDASVELSLPGQYEKLRQHIDSHRWFLGENRQAEITYPEAVKSWYENVYLPLVKILRDGKIMEKFPGRTEADLYLWIIEHRWYLQQTYDADVTMEQAAEKFADEQSPGKKKRKKVSGK